MKPETRTVFIADPLEVLKRMDSLQFDLVFLDTPLYGGYLFDLNEPKAPPYKTFEEYLAYVVSIISQVYRTLNQNGSILLRINPLYPFNPRLFLDRIFGKQNFHGEIIGENQSTKYNPKSVPYVNFESLLFYSKSEKYTFNEPLSSLSQDEIKQQYRYSDKRGRYKLLRLTDPIERLGRSFEWAGVKPPKGQSWRYSIDRLSELAQNNEIDYSGKFPRRKVYFSETENMIPLGFVWRNFPRLKKAEDGLVDFRLQKAIEMASNVDSNVFDPFLTPMSIGTLIQTGRRWSGVSQFEIITRDFPQLKPHSISEINQSDISSVEQIGSDSLPVLMRRLIESEIQAANPQIITENVGQKYAFLVGINHYKDGLLNLNFCINDVIQLDEILTNLGYQVITLHDDVEAENLSPVRANIETELEILSQELQPEDTLYVHFSCHGTIINGESILIVGDTRATTIGNTGLPINRVISCMKSSRARKLVLSLDVCHAGIEMGRALIDQEFIRNVYDMAEGFYLLAASTAEQQAYELPELKHGLFSYYLIQGLKGEADYDFDGRISVTDLKNYVLDQVRRKNGQNFRRQEPTFKSEGIGEITLVYPK